MRIVLAAGILQALMISAAVAAEPPPGTSAHDVILFPDGPALIIRFHLTVNGEPLDAARRKANDAVFQAADVDKDGSLKGAELTWVAAMENFIKQQEINDAEAPSMRQLDRNRDGAVNNEELTEYFRSSIGAEFQLYSNASPSYLVQRDGMVESALVLNEVIFKTLDADAEGHLLPSELTGAAERLSKLDSSGDETVNEKEIAAAQPAATPQAGAETAKPIVQLVEPGKARAAAEPDIAVIIRLGKRDGAGAALELLPGDRAKGQAKVSVRDSTLVVEIGATLVELSVDPMDHKNETPAIDFKETDLDKNGYLDRNEAREGSLGPLFRILDANSDGMLFENEVAKYLDSIRDVQKKTAAANVLLGATRPFGGLFGLIDTNGDGQLGLRELRRAKESLMAADANGDKKIALAESPVRYQIGVSRGLAGMGTFESFEGAADEPPAGPGPLWFNRMDANRDGDLSRREFLGTPEQFKKIDADSDGLIDVTEAKNADAEFRKP